VTLFGILLTGIICAITTFFAYRLDLLQSLGAWMTGDFSVVLKGRYELLWIAGALGIAAYIAADRFTVAGLGQHFTTNLGLNYRRVMLLGLTIVSLVTASVVVTVGSVPFLGLIIPNVVAMMVGDNMRRSLPWVAILGAGFVLVCDIFGRLIIRPYEMPIGAVMGVIGIFSYVGAALQENISGYLIDRGMEVAANGVRVYDFGPVTSFWLASSVVSMLLAATLWRVRLRD